MTQIQKIKKVIEKAIDTNLDIIIYPYGDIGMEVKRVMIEAYGKEPKYIIDNHLAKYNNQIHNATFLDILDSKTAVIILATTDIGIQDDILHGIPEEWQAQTILMEEPCKEKDLKLMRKSLLYGIQKSESIVMENYADRIH